MPILAVALACGGSSLNEADALERLANEFPSASAQQVKLMLDALDVADHVALDLVGREFKMAVFRIACRFDQGLQWSDLVSGIPYDCTHAAAEWRLYLDWHEEAFGLGVDPRGHIAAGRRNLIAYLECELATKARPDCGAFESLAHQISGTALSISPLVTQANGARCLIGTDPGCYP